MSQRHFICLFAACVLFAFIFLPTRLYFLSDDFDSLLFSLYPSHLLKSYRPLSDASLYIDYLLWNMNAAGFHMTNLIIHFACVFCVYFFSKKMFGFQSDQAISSKLALVCSLLFLFYPFHSEAVFWIVGRGAVLCTFFGLLSLIFFLQQERSSFHYLLSLTCFAAALLSYEEAWIIPVIITLFSFVHLQHNKKILLLNISGFWFVFFLYLAGRFYFTQDLIGTPYGSERITGFTISLLCKNFVALVFRSLVLPMQSSVSFIITCISVMIVLAFLIIRFRKKTNTGLMVIAACFLLSLLPVIPLGIDTHDTESERFLYFPSVFLWLFFVPFFSSLFRRRSWLLYLVIVAEAATLWNSYYSFVISSSICQTTITALEKTGRADTLFCHSLPGQYKGAFIFRNGFKSAVKLLKKDSVQCVVIISRSELFHPDINYEPIFSDSAMHAIQSNLYVEWQEDRVIFSR